MSIIEQQWIEIDFLTLDIVDKLTLGCNLITTQKKNKLQRAHSY